MRKFLSNMLSLMIGNMFSLVLGFILSILMLQKLSTADYALQSAFVAFAGIVMGVADLGMFSIGTRELASREEQGDLYCSLLTLQLILSAVVCGGSVILALILNSFPGPQFVLFMLSVFSLVFSYAPIIPTEALMASRGKAKRIAALQTFYALVGCTLGAVILLTGGGIVRLYLMFSLLSLVSIALYMREARRLLPGTGIRLVYQPQEWKRYLRQAIPVGIASAFMQSCIRLGTYLVYTLASTEMLRNTTGYLGVSNLLLTAVISIVWVPYSVNILPLMSRLYIRSRRDWNWIGSRSITLLLAATLPICVGTLILAPDILAVLSPAQVVATDVLRIFIWLLPANVLVSFLYQMLLVQGRQRDYLIATAAGAAANLALCLLLIPPYGAAGAALSGGIGLTVIAVVGLWMLRDSLKPDTRPLDVLRIVAALASMIVVLQLTPGLMIFLRIGLGALVYAVIVLGTRVFTSADRNTALSLMAHER
jgi:O-antigen/teichoic acid export membrane protein